MSQNRRPQKPAHKRALEMLAILQLGLCGRCGRARYATRRTARHAARIAAPGTRLRAYPCGGNWHLTTPPGQPQLVAPPVTVLPARSGRSLALQRRDKRRYPSRHHGRHRGSDRTRRTGQRRPDAGTPTRRR